MVYFGQKQKMRGPSLDLRRQIVSQVSASPDAVWTPTDFLGLGPRAGIDKALQRLVKSGDLCRLDRGLYCRVKARGAFDGNSLPTIQAVLGGIARRDDVRLALDGLSAARDIGLIDEVSSEIVVLCETRLRKLRLGDLTIRFKQAAPSRLRWAGRPAMCVVQALYWVHKSDTTCLGEAAKSIVLRVLADSKFGGAIRLDLQKRLFQQKK